MNRYKGIILSVTLVLMAGTAFALSWFKAHQKLGVPGIIAEAIPGSPLMKFDLPELVLDYTSTNVPTDSVTLGYLPKDTSYAQRYYVAPDRLPILANIILQGADRSSIHKPDYCMSGQGYSVVERSVVNIPIVSPQQMYELPVSRWVGERKYKSQNGQIFEQRCLYVFWFVADREQTPSYDQRRNWIMRDLLRHGILQRWAYVSFQAGCLPGQEDATFDQMKQLIAASVPEFQLPPRPAGAAVVAEH